MATNESFALFTQSLGGRVYSKLTGDPEVRVASWSDLHAKLLEFGAGSSDRSSQLKTGGVDAIGFLSDSEEMIAVPMLMAADLGSVAESLAESCHWWSRYGRIADEQTRRMVAVLVSF